MLLNVSLLSPYILHYVVLLLANTIYFYIVSVTILIDFIVTIMMRECSSMKCKQYEGTKWVRCCVNLVQPSADVRCSAGAKGAFVLFPKQSKSETLCNTS
jgi:hypothetical protein